MLTFCPWCSNVLTIGKKAGNDSFPEGQNFFMCKTCPFEDPIGETGWFERKEMKRKEVDDVVGMEDSKNLDRSNVQCPREECEGSEAYFYQMQTRSADEPMTTYYKCTTCGQRWKEN